MNPSAELTLTTQIKAEAQRGGNEGGASNQYMLNMIYDKKCVARTISIAIPQLL